MQGPCDCQGLFITRTSGSSKYRWIQAELKSCLILCAVFYLHEMLERILLWCARPHRPASQVRSGGSPLGFLASIVLAGVVGEEVKAQKPVCPWRDTSVKHIVTGRGERSRRFDPEVPEDGHQIRAHGTPLSAGTAPSPISQVLTHESSAGGCVALGEDPSVAHTNNSTQCPPLPDRLPNGDNTLVPHASAVQVVDPFQPSSRPRPLSNRRCSGTARPPSKWTRVTTKRFV
jgi:hypothetical protein